MIICGCHKDFKTPDEVLDHLENSIYHFGLSLGNNTQLRAYNGKYYLADYNTPDNSRDITKPEAIALITAGIFS